MEIRTILTILHLLFYQYIFAQKNDDFFINVNINKYNYFAKDYMKERYIYTYNNFTNITKLYSFPKENIISNYEFDYLVLGSIPIFEFKKNIELESNYNFIYNIDFKNDFLRQYINIYYKEKIIGDFYYEQNEDFENEDIKLLNYSLIGDNFDDPIRYGSLHGFLMKLQLETKYFTFFIEQLKDVLFILKKNKIYAITNPDEKGNYEENEINYFFSKKITCEQIKKLNQGKSFVYHKNKKENKSNNYYKVDYIVTIKKD